MTEQVWESIGHWGMFPLPTLLGRRSTDKFVKEWYRAYITPPNLAVIMPKHVWEEV